MASAPSAGIQTLARMSLEPAHIGWSKVWCVHILLHQAGLPRAQLQDLLTPTKMRPHKPMLAEWTNQNSLSLSLSLEDINASDPQVATWRDPIGD